MKFFTIAPLRADIEKYRKKDVYSNCAQDLCNFFANKTIQEIASLPILLTHNKSFHYIKSRILNSNINKGRRACYRLYFYVDVLGEFIYLLGYYPKTGVFGREDLAKTEEKNMIDRFNLEKKNDSLVEHDILNNLVVIEKKQESITAKKQKS